MSINPSEAARAGVIGALESVSPLTITTSDAGVRTLAFSVESSGLYQLNLFMDAGKFDWEVLYQTLDTYGNTNARTGPWDFRLSDAMPLVPAYWVRLDGVKLGLWYAQRVSIEDIAAKRFRGRIAFDVRSVGKHELSLEPYNETARLPWVSAIFEPDPEDWIAAPMKATAGPEALPAAQWATADAQQSAFWSQARKKLATTHAIYAKPLESVFDWAMNKAWGTAESLPALVAAHHLGGRSGSLDKAMHTVRELMNKPAWGREREDVYGHNGDIGGGSALRCMAWAYHMLAPQMTAEERAKLLAKLVYQGDAFITQTLLMRDYWGGSLLQDHGRQAVFDLGVAAMHLWGVTPAAERWVEFSVPRLKRALDAAPIDGVIPASSYNSLFLYLHNVQYYRDALLARTGIDIIEHETFRKIPAYVVSMVDERHNSMMTSDGSSALIGGEATMATLAAKFSDADAARVHKLLVEAPPAEFYHGGQVVGYFAGLLAGFFAYDPANTPAPSAAGAGRKVLHFPDSGIAQFRDDPSGSLLAMRCGPWLGYHAHQRAPGPCDRMECSVGAGHFVLYLDGEAVLLTPDTGYKIQSILRSCLLIDDKGQIGDTGYPMSIPSMPHRGEEIETVRWDEEAGKGLIRLNLTRCYPASSGVSHYTRQFLLASQRRLVVRDHVVLSGARKLSWLFQHRESSGCVITGLSATIGQAKALKITANAPGVELAASVAKTPVVWSYASASHGKPFAHLRYDTAVPTESAAVDFVLSW